MQCTLILLTKHTGMKYAYLLFVFIFLIGAVPGRAQSGDTTGVVLHTDPRLAVLIKKHENIHRGIIRSGRGYRVQIYSGSDRIKATQLKIDFLRRFPGTRIYMTYVSPTFRLKAGDFRDRKSAQNMYQQLSRFYNPCMVVNDYIEINTLHDD